MPTPARLPYNRYYLTLPTLRYLIIGRAEILTASLMAEFVSRSISFLLSGKEYTDTLGTHGPLHT